MALNSVGEPILARVSVDSKVVGAFRVTNIADAAGNSALQLEHIDRVFLLSIQDVDRLHLAIERFRDFVDARGR